VKKNNLYYLIACITLLVAGTYVRTLGEMVEVPLQHLLVRIPNAFGNYINEGIVRPFGNIYNPTADDWILKQYLKKDEDKPIYVYVGYWKNQNEQKKVRPPRYTTEGWGYYWTKTRTLTTGDNNKFQLKEFLNERGDEKELVYYAYIIDGKVIPDEYRFRFLKAVNSLLYRKNNAALLRVSVPVTSDLPVEAAESYIEDFLKDFLPIVKEYLPK